MSVSIAVRTATRLWTMREPRGERLARPPRRYVEAEAVGVAAGVDDGALVDA